ncbi:MAG: cellulase family glycosylhydrolase [Cyanobacteriota bacterium ELA615]
MPKHNQSIIRILSIMGMVTAAHPALSANQTFPPITNQLGFHVEGNQLISNASGRQFVPAGYNAPFGYYLTPPEINGTLTNDYPLTTGLTDLDPRNVPLGQTGANAVRLWTVDHFPPGQGTPPNQIIGLPTLVEQSLQQGLVPILTEGLTTGKNSFDPSNSGNYPQVNGFSVPTFPSYYTDWQGNPQPINTIPGFVPDKPDDWGLWQTIQSWTSPTNLALFQANPDLILNIANEWGAPTFSNNSNSSNAAMEKYWADSYQYAINYLRSKGINNTIMVDTQYGQYAPAILDYGQAIENADPAHNTIFSVHIYNGFNDCTPQPGCQPNYQANLEKSINELANAGVPVIIGEYSNQTYQNTYNYTNLVQLANANKIGWLFWTWDTPGDTPYDSLAPAMYDVSTNPAYGLQALSQNSIYQLEAVPSTFFPGESAFLGLPFFLGMRYLRKKIDKSGKDN